MPAFPSARRLAFGLALALGGTSCGQPQQPAAGPPPPPSVSVATPTTRTIVDKDEYVGRFVPVATVEIRARVSGYLEAVHFTDGQMVKAGDPLFTIDRRAFQNTVDQTRANLAQAQANLAYTQGDLARAQQLVQERTVSQQVFEQRQQAMRNAQAAVAASEAAMRNASLDLEYTELRAPVAGRIGDRRVSPGNLVTGGTGGSTTLLATVVSLDPIRFEFTLDEASLLRYTRMPGHDPASRGMKTPVSLKLLDETGFAHGGAIDFLDNVVDRTSGTIRGRAVFANTSGLFTPGMFGRIQVPASAPYEALLVPDVAIGSDQARKFVFVVDAENTARPKYVTLGEVVEGSRVIKEGLAAGDRVIVNGMARVRPGIKVKPEDPKPEQKPPEAKPPGPAKDEPAASAPRADATEPAAPRAAAPAAAGPAKAAASAPGPATKVD